MRRDSRTDLLTTPIGPTLARLTIPTVIGIVAILFFNLADTYFIGLMGPAELAAVSFTFPVCNVLMNLSMGLGIGTAIHISSRIGRGDLAEARRTAAHALMLAVTIAIPAGLVGMLTLNPLFRLLGATPATIDLIREYMALWYAGFFLLVIPMVGNSVIRATGDTRTPSLIMALAGLCNGIMDPLLIFGLGPFPALGIRGAVIATLLSWLLATVAVLYVLVKRLQLMAFTDLLGPRLAHWRSILRVAIPATTTNLMTPLAASVLTAMAAREGAHTVAGYGVGTRLEALALVVIMALSSALTPFVGQNYGAGQIDRIRTSVWLALRFTLIWELGMALLFWAGGNGLAGLFTDDPETLDAIRWYLWLVPVSYAFQGIVMLSCSTLNALHRPVYGTVISALRLFALAVPLAWFGGWLYDARGLYAGVALANLLAGIGTLIWLQRHFRQLTPPAPVRFPEASP